MKLTIKIATLITLLALPLGLFAQESEEDLNKQALELFDQEEYEKAFKVYSTLLSINVESPEYNFRFGACQLFSSENKEAPLKYLKFAAQKPNPPALAYFYYGWGLHLNYQFDRAVAQYEKYKPLANRKEEEADVVDLHIEQCKQGKQLVSSFTDISVVERTVLPRTEFYRNYDLEEFGGKVMVKPPDFMSEEDKERNAKFLMYFQKDADIIYYASHSEKNETGKDLYSIQKLPGGDWSEPKRLDNTINTPYNEDYPFIHPEGNTLYFASQGHNSMGGYDIFKSDRRGDGSWTPPVNMEFAINTPWDDFMFITDQEENSAWFASNRETSNDQVTVYRIGIERIPLDLTLIKGVFEKEGSRKATITVEDMVQNKVVGVFDSERQLGGYLLDLRGSGQYKFTVEAEESNAIHTGIVEIPREKGLKQFRQEMKLVVTDGQEQLQIINHFDEPIEDEQLLTAEILKKQASLAVNADEDDIESSVEIIDGGSEEADQEITGEGLDNVTKLAMVKKARDEIESDAKELNQKAAALYENVQQKYDSDNPEDLAEASIAAELASTYKREAESRSAALKQMNTMISEMESSSIDDAAFNARYTQIAATQNNFKPIDALEKKIEADFEKRMDPTLSEYEGKVEEVNQLQSDITGIDEEISYYESELENTDDEMIKEELEVQVEEAKEARPVKAAALERAKKELTSLEDQRDKVKRYVGLASKLLTDAATRAPQITNVVSATALNEMKNLLETKAAGNPALVALVSPDRAGEAMDKELQASRKEATEEESDQSIVANQEKDQGDENDQTTTAETNESSGGNINEEINRIEAQESSPEIIEGDLDEYFTNAIAEAEQADDPVIVESNKAELYDNWTENLSVRIDSLTAIREGTEDEGAKTALTEEIASLETDRDEKDALAMESYQRIAELSDAAAARPNQDQTPSSTVQDEATEEIPPISPELLQAGGLPPALEQINEQYQQELTALEESVGSDSAAYKTSKADALNDWADEIQKELDVLAKQIQAAASVEDQRLLEQKAAEVGEYRMELISQATDLRKEVDAEKDQEVADNAQRDLQKQLSAYVENYNESAFEQLEDQINLIPNELQKKAQLETLNKNWLVALQNEKVKTEARYNNTPVEAPQRPELKASIESLTAKSDQVKLTLDSLESDGEVDGPKAPESVYVKGSERFEGYVPVEVPAVDNYESQAGSSSSEAEDAGDEVTALESQLEQTRRKRDRQEIQADIQETETEQKTLQMKSRFYAEAAEKLAAVETQVLTMAPGDPLPSEQQQRVAEEFEQKAIEATQIANVAMERAQEIKKKKKRIPAVQEAEKLQAEAAIQRQEADLAEQLAEEMRAVEEKTIAENYIVLPTYEVVLPATRRELNPTEQADVEATEEFQDYQAEIDEADSLRQQVAQLEAEERQLTQRAQQLMTASSTAPNQAQNGQSKLDLTNRAYADFEQADSISKMAARLTRQATFIENEANRNLLTRPEEVYMNIVAYNNTAVKRPKPVPEPPVVAETVEATEPEAQEQPAQQNQQPIATPDEPEQPFQLDAPQENQRPVDVPQDELTNTIFEISDQPTESNYNARNPIPVDPPLPSGLLYKVQVGAFRNPIPQDIFKGIAPIIGESTPAGFIRYSAGEFNNFLSADDAKERIQSLGYQDAFVVAYYNGQRIPRAQARSLERGENVAVTPITTGGTARPNVQTRYIKQGPIEVSDVSNTSGTFYTVQVGVFSQPVTGNDIYNITPLQQENLDNGLYRYTTGKFQDLTIANKAKDEAVALGISDAFVTQYRDGTRIGVNIPQGTSSTPVPPAASGQQYKVLLGTFTDRVPVNVASKILTLSSQGVDKVTNPDGTKSYYFGSFSKAEAERQAAQLRNEGLTEAKAVAL